MTPEDRKAFEAFVLETLPKGLKAVEWALAHGYRIHKSCVYGYMKKIKVLDDMRRCADASASLVADADSGDLVDATRRLMRQRLFETLYAGVKKGEFAAKDIKDLTAAEKNIVQREEIDLAIRETERKRLKEETAEQMKTLKDKSQAGGTITDADLEEVGKKIFG